MNAVMVFIRIGNIQCNVIIKFYTVLLPDRFIIKIYINYDDFATYLLFIIFHYSLSTKNTKNAIYNRI